MMTVRVLAFAALREIVGSSVEVACPAGARIGDVWSMLERMHPALSRWNDTVRFARNGTVVGADAAISQGDEIALLPPVGGG